MSDWFGGFGVGCGFGHIPPGNIEQSQPDKLSVTISSPNTRFIGFSFGVFVALSIVETPRDVDASILQVPDSLGSVPPNRDYWPLRAS